MEHNIFIHEKAEVQTDAVGHDTQIWQYSIILKGANIGSNCNINSHCFIENDVVIGNNVTLKCGVYLWDGITIEDDVFIGPNVTFTNDKHPRSKIYPDKFLRITVKKGASIGANATILPGLTIGKHAMIGAGAVVTRNVPPNAIVVGNPAYIKGYVSSSSVKQPFKADILQEPAPRAIPSIVKGAYIYKLPVINDMRGSLSVAEYGQFLPFIPKRYFLVFDVVSREIRGEHAHKSLHQFLICTKGSCSILVDDGFNREEILLDSPNIAVHIPPMVWGIQYKYSPDAVLLVLASDIYDPEDYIRDYDEFIEAVRRQ